MTHERRDVNATNRRDDAGLVISPEEVAAQEVIELPDRELLQSWAVSYAYIETGSIAEGNAEATSSLKYSSEVEARAEE